MLSDIGLGELIFIAVLALIVFGPDRLPKVASDAAKTLRQVRVAAASARRDLADAAGLDSDEELAGAVRDLRDLDPRRALTSALTEDAEPRPAAQPRPTTAQGAAAASAPQQGQAVPSAADPVAPPVIAPEPVDPDWT